MTRWGGQEENPTEEQLREALAELATPDLEHPSALLSDDDNYTVAVYETGLVTYSREFTDICERRGVSFPEALELWLLLQQGRRTEIQQLLSA